MSLDHKIAQTITLGAPTISRAGFSTMMVLGKPTFSETIKYYGPDDDYENDGDLTSDIIDALTRAFGQDPAPKQVGVGKRAADAAQKIEFTITGASDGDYTITINGTDYTYTATSDTVAGIASGLATAVDADADVSATDDGVDTVTVTADTAGEPFTYDSSSTGDPITETEAQANVSVKTELAKVLQADSDWFGFVLISRNETDILRAAEWAEANDRLFFAQLKDTDAVTSATTDVGTKLKNKSYDNTSYDYFSDDTKRFDAGYMARLLTYDFDQTAPTAAYLTIKGIDPDVDDTDAQKNLEDKNANYYSTLKGTGATFPGVVASGKDIEHVITGHWVRARLSEAIAQLFLDTSNRGERIPFNDQGFGRFKQVTLDVLREGEDIGHFTDQTAEVDMPKRADVSDADVQNGLLRYSWGVQYSGTIKEVSLTGYVTLDFEGFAAA